MVDRMLTRTTVDEFLTMPESNLPTELIGGEVIVSPAPELFHQDVAGNIYNLLRSVKLGKAYFSPVDVLFGDHVLQPDVVWLAPNTTCENVDGKRLRGGPDLVAEVLSPGTALRDRGEKFDLYQAHGVREYWMVEPNARFVEVWVRENDAFVRVGVYGETQQFASAVLGRDVSVKVIFSTTTIEGN